MSWPTHKTYAVDTTQTRRDITVHMGDHVLHTWFHEVGPPDFDARIPHEHVRECAVPLNTVCEHGVFCTDNLAVAEMVARLCGAEKRERAAVVAWLRAVSTTRMWQQAPMDDAADCIERGEHRTRREQVSDVALGLFAEIERLRKELDYLNNQRRLDNGDLARAYDEGRDNERAATVAWLREPSLDRACCKERVALEADAIENGDHRREGEP